MGSGNEPLRPFGNSRTQREWDEECVESACFELLPSNHKTQSGEPVEAAWQEVHAHAQSYDGFTGTAEFVKGLLDSNALDTIDVEQTESGYRIRRV